MSNTVLMSGVFFIALIWFVAWLSSITTKAYLIGEQEKLDREKARVARLKQQQEKELKQTVRAKPKKVPVFIDAEEDEEDYEEAPEKPEFRYAYDPVSHSVKRVPFDD